MILHRVSLRLLRVPFSLLPKMISINCNQFRQNLVQTFQWQSPLYYIVLDQQLCRQSTHIKGLAYKLREVGSGDKAGKVQGWVKPTMAKNRWYAWMPSLGLKA